MNKNKSKFGDVVFLGYMKIDINLSILHYHLYYVTQIANIHLNYKNMKNKIVLISCVSKKQSCKSRVRDFYISTLFKLNLKYAEKLEPNGIYVLSAKYVLLSLDEEIEPYNQTLNEMSAAKIKSWSDEILLQINHFSDIKNTKYIFLAGDKYRKYLLPHLKDYAIPLKGLAIGKQLKKLKELTS